MLSLGLSLLSLLLGYYIRCTCLIGTVLIGLALVRVAHVGVRKMGRGGTLTGPWSEPLSKSSKAAQGGVTVPRTRRVARQTDSHNFVINVMWASIFIT